MEFKEILAALATACGLERLEPDESNMVHLGAEGAALTIVGEDETRTAVLMSEIGSLPAEGRERFFAEALKANWLFQGGGGATLAINPETDALALNQALPLDVLDGERFVGAVRRFLAVLVRWRSLARDWSDAVKGGSAGVADTAVPSGEGAVASEIGHCCLRLAVFVSGIPGLSRFRKETMSLAGLICNTESRIRGGAGRVLGGWLRDMKHLSAPIQQMTSLSDSVGG